MRLSCDICICADSEPTEIQVVFTPRCSTVHCVLSFFFFFFFGVVCTKTGKFFLKTPFFLWQSCPPLALHARPNCRASPSASVLRRRLSFKADSCKHAVVNDVPGATLTRRGCRSRSSTGLATVYTAGVRTNGQYLSGKWTRCAHIHADPAPNAIWLPHVLLVSSPWWTFAHFFVILVSYDCLNTDSRAHWHTHAV